MKALADAHQDVVVDVAFDYYGKRMATCSADHTVKVFSRTDDDEWNPVESWTAHEALVVRLSWAGVEYSSILATASHDCTVKVWEEDSSRAPMSGRRWRRLCTISDYTGPLYSLQFSPAHAVLRLASIASDGVLRVHEALNSNRPGDFSQIAEVPLLNHPVAKQLQSSFSLSWCPSPEGSQYIVACALEDAFLYHYDGTSYKRIGELPSHKGLIRDVAWANSMARSYHTIATACKDGNVRVFRLTPEQNSPGFVVKLELEAAEHQGEVWRVSWNLSGTILASSGDSPDVKFWKRNQFGALECLAKVSTEQG